MGIQPPQLLPLLQRLATRTAGRNRLGFSSAGILRFQLLRQACRSRRVRANLDRHIQRICGLQVGNNGVNIGVTGRDADDSNNHDGMDMSLLFADAWGSSVEFR
jgi:hypothetical protein